MMPLANAGGLPNRFRYLLQVEEIRLDLIRYLNSSTEFCTTRRAHACPTSWDQARHGVVSGCLLQSVVCEGLAEPRHPLPRWMQ